MGWRRLKVKGGSVVGFSKYVEELLYGGEGRMTHDRRETEIGFDFGQSFHCSRQGPERMYLVLPLVV